MIIINFIIITFFAFLFSWVGTWLLRMGLRFLQVMDIPNERSNHQLPVPRGGGLAVILAALGFMAVAAARGDILFGALVLAVVSFVDDVKGLSARLRLLVQALVVILALDALDGLVFQGLLPLVLDRFAAAVLWLWFINLFNFMDGIDGIAATETMSLGVGLSLLALILPNMHPGIDVDGAILAAAAYGFWRWNRHPATVFLGDAGSIPLGFLLGYLLLNCAGSGYWAVALILPAYYLCDTTITLFARMQRGAVLSQAHSEHFYQQAARSGIAVPAINRYLLGLNIALLGLAALSTLGGWWTYGAITAAYFLVLALLSYFAVPIKTLAHVA